MGGWRPAASWSERIALDRPYPSGHSGQMKSASITELKNGLSGYIDRVKAGDPVLVTDRGVPVAVLQPVATQVDSDERMARLEREGIVRRGAGAVPLDLLRRPGPTPRGGASVVGALLDERRSGR